VHCLASRMLSNSCKKNCFPPSPCRGQDVPLTHLAGRKFLMTSLNIPDLPPVTQFPVGQPATLVPATWLLDPVLSAVST
jgi:hypothetical protein